jgi:mono/diheme cytochrome c family protein
MKARPRGSYCLLAAGALAVALVAMACASAAAPTPTPSPTVGATPTAGLPAAGDVGAGKAVFDSVCTACHPEGRQGAGPSILGVVERLGEVKVREAVRQGKGVMPALTADRLSDKQLADLMAFLRTLR